MSINVTGFSNITFPEESSEEVSIFTSYTCWPFMISSKLASISMLNVSISSSVTVNVKTCVALLKTSSNVYVILYVTDLFPLLKWPASIISDAVMSFELMSKVLL